MLGLKLRLILINRESNRVSSSEHMGYSSFRSAAGTNALSDGIIQFNLLTMVENKMDLSAHGQDGAFPAMYLFKACFFKQHLSRDSGSH